MRTGRTWRWCSTPSGTTRTCSPTRPRSWTPSRAGCSRRAPSGAPSSSTSAMREAPGSPARLDGRVARVVRVRLAADGSPSGERRDRRPPRIARAASSPSSAPTSARGRRRTAAPAGPPQRRQRPLRRRGRASLLGVPGGHRGGPGHVPRRRPAAGAQGRADGHRRLRRLRPPPHGHRRQHCGAARAPPGRRIIAVYEPLTFHRTAAMLEQFADVMADADEAYVADIWAGRDPDTTITSPLALASAINARGRAPAAPTGFRGGHRRLPRGTGAAGRRGAGDGRRSLVRDRRSARREPQPLGRRRGRVD